MLVISVSSLKGGVGKTSVTLGLTSAAVARGIPTLVVDMDPQADASTGLNVPVTTDVDIADVLAAPKNRFVERAFVPSGWTDGSRGVLDVIPGSPRSAEFDRPSLSERYLRRLDTALTKFAGDYRLVLIDCPPSLNGLTRAAWTASQRVAVVTEPGLFSVAAADRALRAADELRRRTAPKLQPLGLVVNRMRQNSREHDFRVQELRDMFGPLVLSPPVVERTVLQQAQGSAQPIHRWPGDAAAELASSFDALLDRALRSESIRSRRGGRRGRGAAADDSAQDRAPKTDSVDATDETASVAEGASQNRAEAGGAGPAAAGTAAAVGVAGAGAAGLAAAHRTDAESDASDAHQAADSSEHIAESTPADDSGASTQIDPEDHAADAETADDPRTDPTTEKSDAAQADAQPADAGAETEDRDAPVETGSAADEDSQLSEPFASAPGDDAADSPDDEADGNSVDGFAAPEHEIDEPADRRTSDEGASAGTDAEVDSSDGRTLNGTPSATADETADSSSTGAAAEPSAEDAEADDASSTQLPWASEAPSRDAAETDDAPRSIFGDDRASHDTDTADAADSAAEDQAARSLWGGDARPAEPPKPATAPLPWAAAPPQPSAPPAVPAAESGASSGSDIFAAAEKHAQTDGGASDDHLRL